VVEVSSADLAAAVLIGVVVAVLLGVLVWLDYRDDGSQTTIRRAADQHRTFTADEPEPATLRQGDR
jgi:uncharacterized membrane protein YccC